MSTIVEPAISFSDFGPYVFYHTCFSKTYERGSTVDGNWWFTRCRFLVLISGVFDNVWICTFIWKFWLLNFNYFVSVIFPWEMAAHLKLWHCKIFMSFDGLASVFAYPRFWVSFRVMIGQPSHGTQMKSFITILSDVEASLWLTFMYISFAVHPCLNTERNTCQ